MTTTTTTTTTTGSSSYRHAATRAAALAQTIALVQRQGMHFDRRIQDGLGSNSKAEEVFIAQSAATGKVASVVRLTPHGRVFVAFTTKDPMFNDNFDFEAGKTVPVENCTFGAAKLYVEASEIFGFCSDPIGHSDAYVVESLLPKFEALLGVPAEACARLRTALLDEAGSEQQRMAARREFMARDVLAPRVGATDKALLAFAQKKGITARDDALVETCEKRAEAITANSARAQDADATPLEIVSLYCEARMQLLSKEGGIADTNPRIAKLALGRQTLFPLLQDIWSSHEVDLGAWAVHFVRRYFMAHNPDHAYLFCLLHRHGLACEVSDNDDLWAKKVPENANKKAGALCIAKSTGIVPTTILDLVEEAAPTRKLGVVNRRVARALLGLPSEEVQNGSVGGTSAFAEAYLVRCGWAAWFKDVIAPRCGGGSGSSIFPQQALLLPEPLREAICESTLVDVRHTLHALVVATSSSAAFESPSSSAASCGY